MKKATRGRKPFPPGRYPVVIIGSGPGGLQTSYALRRLRVEHAVLSADAGPGGMFLRFPLFQRRTGGSNPTRRPAGAPRRDPGTAGTARLPTPGPPRPRAGDSRVVLTHTRPLGTCAAG